MRMPMSSVAIAVVAKLTPYLTTPRPFSKKKSPAPGPTARPGCAALRSAPLATI